MGTVTETAVIGDGCQGIIRMLKHRFGLPEPVILYINDGRAAEKLLEVANVGGTGHTGYGVKALQFDFFTVVCVNIFYRFQKIKQIPLSVIIGRFFVFDHIADLGDHIQRQMLLFLLGVVFVFRLKQGQFVEYSC